MPAPDPVSAPEVQQSRSGPEAVSAVARRLMQVASILQAVRRPCSDSRDVPAWSERRQYAELAAEYGGYHVPRKNDHGQAGTGVILILPDAQLRPAPANNPVIEAVPNATARELVEGEDDGQDSY